MPRKKLCEKLCCWRKGPASELQQYSSTSIRLSLLRVCTAEKETPVYSSTAVSYDEGTKLAIAGDFFLFSRPCLGDNRNSSDTRVGGLILDNPVTAIVFFLQRPMSCCRYLWGWAFAAGRQHFQVRVYS